jgi:uncharacterized repeat protein (TIGR03803 family)
MYTTAGAGGAGGQGGLLQFDPSSKVATLLYSFQGGADGAQPVPGLALMKDGILYGATATGGTSNLGTVFKFDIKSGTETVLHSFSGSDGQTPQYGPVVGANGSLYGTTSVGGTSNLGVAYSLKPSSGKEAVIVNFTGTNGSHPNALTVGPAGLLYGTSANGGAYTYYGNLFTIDTATSVQTILYSFNGNERMQSPSWAVIVGQNGLIYGTGSLDGFSFDPATGVASDLDSYSSGCDPSAALISDASGNLYGTCHNGGGFGVVFEYSPASSVTTDLWTFDGAPYFKVVKGAEPAGIAFGKDGRIYGATLAGGSTWKIDPPGYGLIYRLVP